MLKTFKLSFSIALIILISGLITYLLYTLFFQSNLNKFTSITSKDPLFYDPSTEVDFLEQSVKDLESLNDQIILTDEKYRKSNQDFYPTNWKLWPTAFLAVLPKIHRETEDFLKAPTEKKGEELIESYNIAGDAYETAIDAHIAALSAFLAVNPDIKNRKILFLGSATTPQIVLDDFLLIKKNAEVIKSEIARREDCLKNGVCNNMLPTTHINSNNRTEKIPFKPLSDDLLNIDTNNSGQFGPYWAETGCFGFTKDNKKLNHPFYLVLRTNEKGKGILVKPIMTNTKYYLNQDSNLMGTSRPLYAKLGIKLRPHAAENDYMCTDLTYLADLYSQYLMEKDGKKNPTSEKSKLAVIPYLIQHTLSVSDFPIYYTEYVQNSPDPLFYLVARTAYSIYFGTFSRAVWRINDNPKFLLNEDYSKYVKESGYITYEELSKNMSKAEIIKLNNFTHVDEVFKNAIEERNSKNQ